MEHIIVFTKYPHPGFAKTRLIPRFGAKGAAEVSRALTERCVATVRGYVTNGQNRQVRIYYAGQTTLHEMREWLGDDAKYVPQCEGDLGARMVNALKMSFDEGAARVCIVGTDIPELTCGILGDALDKLRSVDVVVGPAVDGGYYLIGMNRLYADLFRDVKWSTSEVFKTTKCRAEENGLTLIQLNMLRDVDLPGDVDYLTKFIQVPKLT